MKTFEESRFPERIVANSGLTEMVRCTDVMPDAKELPVGTIYHLTSAQANYQVNHIYMCKKISGINVWYDITENHDVFPDASGCTASGKLVLYLDVMLRLYATWTTPVDGTNDVWVRDVLLRKLDESPINLTDGELITSSIIRNQYATTETEYHSGPITISPAGQAYHYRVFHVFGSGKMTYTDMTVDET